MMFKAKIRRVGNSLGIIVPKEVLEKDNIKEGDEVIVKEIEKVSIRAVFGIWKGLPPLKHLEEDHEL